MELLGEFDEDGSVAKSIAIRVSDPDLEICFAIKEGPCRNNLDGRRPRRLLQRSLPQVRSLAETAPDFAPSDDCGNRLLELGCHEGECGKRWNFHI